MELEEFRKRLEEDQDWAAGWEALDEAFNAVHGEQEPLHYPTINKAALGGQEYLDGYSVYTSKLGHKHFLTYGFSELYADEESLGGEYNGCGFELTAKWEDNELSTIMTAIYMCVASDLGRHTYKNKAFYDHGHIVRLDFSIYLDRIRAENRTSNIKAVIVVYDTEVDSLDSLYGKVDFLQLVGITQEEIDYLTENYERIEEFIKNKKKDNPYLLTSLNA